MYEDYPTKTCQYHKLMFATECIFCNNPKFNKKKNQAFC